MSGHSEPPLVDKEVRAVLGVGARDVSAVEQLYEPVASASIGIWRVRAGEQSAVLKLIAHSDAGHENWRSGDDPAHWYYWRREVLAYESGLLASMAGGLRAPHCDLVAERPDGSVALWLEDVAGAPGAAWPLARYKQAARHLGQTQGAYLTGHPLLDQPWLSRDWLRTYLLQRDGDRHLVREPQAWQHPLVAERFPDPPIDRLIAMRADQSLFLDALDELPRTLCHLDLHPANLFADGDASTVAIDWSFVGTGALGEDAGNLVPDSVFDFHVDPRDLYDLYELVARGYEAGLRDAGWAGSPALVHLGMAATIAAKYAWIAPRFSAPRPRTVRCSIAGPLPRHFIGGHRRSRSCSTERTRPAPSSARPAERWIRLREPFSLGYAGKWTINARSGIARTAFAEKNPLLRATFCGGAASLGAESRDEEAGACKVEREGLVARCEPQRLQRSS